MKLFYNNKFIVKLISVTKCMIWQSNNHSKYILLPFTSSYKTNTVIDYLSRDKIVFYLVIELQFSIKN